MEGYHKALALRPEDTFSAEMLTKALGESFEPQVVDWHVPSPRSAFLGGFSVDLDYVPDGARPLASPAAPAALETTMDESAESPHFHGAFLGGDKSSLHDEESYNLDGSGELSCGVVAGREWKQPSCE